MYTNTGFCYEKSDKSDKKIYTVLCGLLVASIFIIPFVEGIINHEQSLKGSGLIGVGVLVLLAFTTLIISVNCMAHVKQRATAQTSGVIIHAKRNLIGDEYDTDNGYWYRIRYCVDRQEYQITKYVYLKNGINGKQYVNRSVTVHYDPNNPGTAWAEWPWEKVE